jgi:hypothetical protein
MPINAIVLQSFGSTIIRAGLGVLWDLCLNQRLIFKIRAGLGGEDRKLVANWLHEQPKKKR